MDYYDLLLAGKISGGGGGSGEWTTDGIASGTEPNGAIVLGNSVTSIVNYAFDNHPITSIVGPEVTSIGAESLNNTQITEITDTSFPKLGKSELCVLVLRLPLTCTKIKLTGSYIALSSGSYALRDCKGLVTAEFPYAAKDVGNIYKGLGAYCFNGCSNLELADCGEVTNISNSAFQNATKLTTIVLRSTSVVSLAGSGAFNNTPFKSGGTGGTIYIPESLYDHLGDNSSSDYKHATNWLTVDGYGTITWAKIEGSIYEL